MDVSGCGLRNSKSNGSITSLPDDVISKILLEFPADELLNVMRLVCRDWDRVIHHPDFIKRHRRLPACLIVGAAMGNPYGTRVGYIVKVEASEKEDELPSRVINISDETHPFHRSFADTCDGLVLIEDFTRADRKVLYHIVNPLRKQHLTLSPAPAHERLSCIVFSSIAYARSSGQYKVVLDYATDLDPLKIVVLISTVGGDGSWRSVDMDHIPPDDLHALFGESRVIGPKGYRNSVGGFVYWHSVNKPFTIFALDVENETMLKVNTGQVLAQLGDDTGKKHHYKCEHKRKFIKSEHFLILVAKRIISSWHDDAVWEFWALVDTKHGQWEKLYEIDVGKSFPCKQPGMFSWQPFHVFEDDDVVLFSDSFTDFFLGYQVKTGKTFRFGNARLEGSCEIFAHVQSLVPLQG